MALDPDQIFTFLRSVHPYDALPAEAQTHLAGAFVARTCPAGAEIYRLGDPMPGLFLIHDGRVEITDERGETVSQLGVRNSFGERGLIRDGVAVTSARADSDATLLMLPAAEFQALIRDHAPARRFFDRSRGSRAQASDLTTTRVDTLMARPPLTCGPDETVRGAARTMRERHTSSICVTEGGRLLGIVTLRDLSGKVVAEGLPGDTPVAQIMTRDPVTLPPTAIGSDVLHMMMERRVGHVPISHAGQLAGIVTQTDLTRFQAVSSGELVAEIARADGAEAMALVTARIPRLLLQLVAGGSRHEVVTRLITDITDTATRRLVALAEERFGPPPVPYLWLACGSQGRQEQTGISDQDNCLFLHDDVTEDMMPWFRDLARFVCDGLDRAGYFHCPGDMMATNPKWCQPLRVWRQYFRGWIDKPDPMAQMLASVMFDLRPIAGDMSLFADLHAQTLDQAARNSIFVAHMISNSLKHTPPLGLFRGFATLRSGEHRNQIDLKLNGVVPVVDLGRIYALQGRLTAVNTRARLEAAQGAGVLSQSGGRDLLDAYDLIAETRLNHQAALVRKGARPDNFLTPSDLSEFERSHLRDAFVVVKSMQSALGHGRGMLG